jgi:transcriptional regulator with XRE-family HTH domain
MLHKRFQRRLKEARTELGVTQAEMARRLAISQPAYADIETGRSEPRLSTIERIATVLGVEAGDLISREKIPA